VSIERGYDPRAFTMMAFGGGGPLHACALAEELDVPRIIIPARPGLFSAYGLLAADVRAAYVRSVVERLDRIDEAVLAAAFAGMEVEGAAELRAQGVAPADAAFVREYDMRYYGQSFELSVPYAPNTGAVLQAFHDKHERTYGYASPTEAVEIVNARLVAIGRIPKPVLRASQVQAQREPAADARLGERELWIAGERVTAPVFARERLASGNALAGPCVVEQYDSCTYVAPGWRCTVDPLGNLDLERVGK
jgi:N-methylhydantoinase A